MVLYFVDKVVDVLTIKICECYGWEITFKLIGILSTGCWLCRYVSLGLLIEITKYLRRYVIYGKGYIRDSDYCLLLK